MILLFFRIIFCSSPSNISIIPEITAQLHPLSRYILIRTGSNDLKTDNKLNVHLQLKMGQVL